MIKQIWESVLRLWCRKMHRDISTPVNGIYRCWTCHRAYSTKF